MFFFHCGHFYDMDPSFFIYCLNFFLFVRRRNRDKKKNTVLTAGMNKFNEILSFVH